MKKNCLFFIIGLLCFNLLSANNNVVIKGVLKEVIGFKFDEKFKPKTITLRKVVDGALLDYKESKLNDKGEFSFEFNIDDEAIWTIGTKLSNIRLYIKPNDQLNVEIEKGQTYSFIGKVNEENKILTEWNTIYNEMFGDLSPNYDVLYPQIPAFLKKSKKLRKKIRSRNKTFVNIMTLCYEIDIKNGFLHYLFMPHSKHPTKDQLAPIYNEITSNIDFNNANILKLPMGSRYMESHFLYKVIYGDVKIDMTEFTKWKIDNILNDTLKGVCFVNNLRTYRSYERIQEAYEMYKKYIFSDFQKEKIAAYIKDKSESQKGQKAFDFTYPNMEEKKISLSDFVGKVVLVDVWATWCGPCKSEIPHLEKLEKELREKNIVFMSVSTDTDKKKWMDFIKEKNLGGIQLWANGFSKICKDYKIKGIPRFMIFDKNGNIYDADTYRPSNPKLKLQLEKALAF